MSGITKRLGLVLAALLLLGLGTAVTGGAAAPAGAAENALLRVVHASPDAPAIEVFLDGQRVLAALAFSTATPYVSVPSGMHQVRALSASGGPGGKALIETTIDLQPGQAYTLVAVDTLAKMGPVVIADTTTPPAADKAIVRLFHASPDAPAVADIAIAGGGPVVFKNVPFKAGTDYLAVAPGQYRFEVRPAGTFQAIATTPPITLVAGRGYTVFAMGLLGDNTFQAVVFADQSATGGVGAGPSAGAGGGTAPPFPPALAATLLAAALLALPVLARPRRARA